MASAAGLQYVRSKLEAWLCPGYKDHTLFFFFKDYLMWTILKVFIKFVTTLLLFYVLVFWPQGMWDLSYPHQEANTHSVH